jgi:hypothetical protein
VLSRCRQLASVQYWRIVSGGRKAPEAFFGNRSTLPRDCHARGLISDRTRIAQVIPPRPTQILPGHCISNPRPEK